MRNQADFGYNERLFNGGFRSYLHMARFRWLKESLAMLRCTPESVLELGCFDGKLIDLLPERPKRYVGYDANWEGGLELALQRWRDFPNYDFHFCTVPDEMNLAGERFDIAVVMETLEHVPPPLVEGYLRKMADGVRNYVFITVPNEMGVLFLGKWLVKRVLSSDAEKYTPFELLNATLGRMSKVERHEHKGFDHAALVKQVGKYFDLVHISGHPLGFLPASLCFGIGIIGKKVTQ